MTSIKVVVPSIRGLVAVDITKDGVTWSAPVAKGVGQLGITTVAFPAQTARYLRIAQTGTDPMYYWSIYGLDVYR